MANDLTPTITTAAGQPLEVSGDAGSVREQSIESLIKADQYLKLAAGVGLHQRGLYLSKLIPAGAMADNGASGLGGLVNFDNGIG
ncbi:MAG TPA: hypothetical protein VKS79_21260 [Gemmataceae bacterium]|nr:hypothetical protein [Gemmataceae bacterium]